VTSERSTTLMEAGALPPPARSAHASLVRGLDLTDRTCTGLLALILTVAILMLGATVAGYHPLIDYSDSMRPAIKAGDVLITHNEPASSIKRGDIVSFIDPGLREKLVTHRVIAIRARDQRIDFLTRGDANAAPESWSAPERGSVSKLVLRVPAVGRALAWMSDGWTRTVVLSVAALLLSAELLRRVWKP
jgi:signal peptidase I